jgi:hypothetical protein
MLLIVQNGLFHSISSNYWQRRYWVVSLPCCLCVNWLDLFILLVDVLQYDLELVLMKNFHEFVHEYMQKPEFTELMRRLGALGDGRHDQSNFTPNLAEWLRRWFLPRFNTNMKMQVLCHRMSGKFPISISRLSCVRYPETHSPHLILLTSEWHTQFGNTFYFSQRGQPPSQRRSNNANRGKTFLTEADIEVIEI